MRLDEVTQLAGGLCLRFTDGSVKHMDNEEAWDAVDKLTVALERRARAFESGRQEQCRHQNWTYERGKGSRCSDCGVPGGLSDMTKSGTVLRRVK